MVQQALWILHGGYLAWRAIRAVRGIVPTINRFQNGSSDTQNFFIAQKLFQAANLQIESEFVAMFKNRLLMLDIIVILYYDNILMKKVITKEEVSAAIKQLVDAGKKPTFAALYAAMEYRGSMSTLVKLKAEIDSEAEKPIDSPAALDAFREVWALARKEKDKETDQLMANLRESINALSSENERSEGALAAAQKRAADLDQQKSKVETELNQFRINAERDLSRASAAARDSGIQAAKALQELSDVRGAHAAQIAAMQAKLSSSQRAAHDFEIQLVRARALLEAKGFSPEKIPTAKSI